MARPLSAHFHLRPPASQVLSVGSLTSLLGDRIAMRSHKNGLDRSPIHLLHRAGQVAEEVFGTEMDGSNLTPRQLTVLLTVATHPGLNQLKLTELTGIDRSTLAELSKRLQKRGLLERRRTEEDARAYAVKVTNEGERLLRKAGPAAKRIDTRVLGALAPERQEQFMENLCTIVTKLEQGKP
jgi:MarR family transcriptional regulator, temperature-dependent positive regulator of motility